MKDNTVSFLEDYVNSISPSGFEGEAAELWKEEAKKFAGKIHGDRHGNSFAVLNEGGDPKVMMAGHTDEIGLMVTQIDENGYLFFTTIGGWDNQVFPGQRVKIRGKNDAVLGVIGRKPIHLIEKEDRKEVVKPENLWIDIGVSDKEKAEELVEVGAPAVIDYEFRRLQGNIAAARGFDDKSGGFVVLEAAKKLAGLEPEAEIHAVATVQEEIGLRGAKTSAYGIDPDIGIAVDVGFATDTPMMEKEKRKVGDTAVGKGPILAKGPNINPILFDKIEEVAETQDIPYQVVGAPEGTGTDANAIQLTKAGVATALVSIPNRYMHSPCEIVSLEDIENAAELISKTIETISEDKFELF